MKGKGHKRKKIDRGNMGVTVGGEKKLRGRENVKRKRKEKLETDKRVEEARGGG